MVSLSKFWGATKRVFAWIKANSAILLLSFTLLAISIIIFVCERRKVKELQVELAVLKTKLKLEKLAVENDITLQDLKELKEKDTIIQEKIKTIETDLKKDLPKDMTMEEMVAVFVSLGIRKKV